MFSIINGLPSFHLQEPIYIVFDAAKQHYDALEKVAFVDNDALGEKNMDTS